MMQVGRAGVAALGAVLVVDVVLVGLAFKHVQNHVATGVVADAVPTGKPTGKAGKGGTGDKGHKPPKKTTKPPDKSAGRVLVDIGTEKAVARAVSGSCGKGGGAVELSRDGGKTWTKAQIPGAEVVVRLASTNIDETQVYAADKSCSTFTKYATSNGGGTWQSVEGAAGSWHVLAEPEAKVHAPSGIVEVPCADGETVAGLSTLSNDTAYALCTDGAVARTRDGGSTWGNRGGDPGATDVDFADEENGIAVLPAGASGSSCKGVRVDKTSDGGQSWEKGTCIQTDQTGPADVSINNNRAYVAAGTGVWFSDDGGDSWAPTAG